MATINIDWTKDIHTRTRNVADEITDKIEIESKELRKYINKKIANSNWKRIRRK